MHNIDDVIHTLRYASLGVEDKIVFQQGLHLDADFPAALHSDWRPATRSPKSTLHLYSKVLSVLPGQKKLPLPQCTGTGKKMCSFLFFFSLFFFLLIFFYETRGH